jgi:hypothetical protein
MVVHMLSPDGSRDQHYVSNYATLNVKDRAGASKASATSSSVRRARLFDAGVARPGRSPRAA